jgi:DHA1 family multidrug resistance protein-like MFS transporter
MLSLVWQPFILNLGGTTKIIGLYESIWRMVMSFLQLGTGELSDSLGRKRLLVAYFVISLVGIGLSILAQSWTYLLPSILLFAVADALGEPAFLPLFAESVEERRRGTAFSLLSMTWFLPGLYSQLLAGFMGDRIGVRKVLYITLGLEFVALLVFVFFVEETLREPKPVEIKSMVKSIRESLRPHKDLLSFYTLSILDNLSWGLSGGIFVAMLYESFNFSLLQIGILTTMVSVASAISLIPAGKLVDSRGSKGALIMSVLLTAVMFLGYVLTRNFLLFVFLQFLKGLAIALWDPAHNAYLSNVVDESERGKVFGNLNGLKGMLVFPAPVIGAFLYANFGFTSVFAVSLIVSLITLFFAYKIK